MEILRRDWMKYVENLSKADDKAAELITDYLSEHSILSDEGFQKFVDYYYAVVTKYAEGASEMAAQAYEILAEVQGATIKSAEPAETPTYGECMKTIRGTMLDSDQAKSLAQSAGRLVRRTGVDTTINNALRDGAEWAWVPNGDTCAFCMMLASNGWQRASKKAIKNGHASHVHANCDCTYAIRFDGKSTVEGYDPDYYKAIYDKAEGDTWQEKLNSMRRDKYAANPEKYREQKRIAYAKARQLSFEPQKVTITREGKEKQYLRTTDGKYGILVSEEASLKKQGLSNIEKSIDDTLEKLGIEKNTQLPQIVILSDNEMGDDYARYNYIHNTLYLNASVGNKRKNIKRQRYHGFASPDDPNSTMRHEMIHWKDAEEYKKSGNTITLDNYKEYLNYLDERGKIKLNEAGISEKNIHTVSRYATQRYIVRNDYDEAYTEYRVIYGE